MKGDPQRLALTDIDRRLASLRLISPLALRHLRTSIEREGIHHPVLVSSAVELQRWVLLGGFKRVRVAEELKRQVRPPTPRASKLDRYAKQIEAWLAEYEDLTAVRLHEKLEAEGFDGGYTIVRKHLKARRGRQPPRQAFEVVETPPGSRFSSTGRLGGWPRPSPRNFAGTNAIRGPSSITFSACS